MYIYIYTQRERVSEVAQLCLTLCDPMDCSLPGSSVHGIFQAIVLEWIAISFSRWSSQPRDRTWVSRIIDRCFTIWATIYIYIYTYIFLSAMFCSSVHKLWPIGSIRPPFVLIRPMTKYCANIFKEVLKNERIFERDHQFHKTYNIHYLALEEKICNCCFVVFCN